MTDAEETPVPDETEAPEVVDELTEVPAETTDTDTDSTPRRSIDWPRIVAFGVLPALALILALAAGGLKYLDESVANSALAGKDSVQAAKDGTVAILSYTPDKVDQQLNEARDLLSGGFRDSYTSLINDVVIPGAREKQISAVATVPGASVVSAEANHAVVLVFVNQAVVVGSDAPTDTASSVNVTMDKVDGKWLISAFDPV